MDEHVQQRLLEAFPQGQSMIHPPFADLHGDLTLYAWLRLDNPDELSAQLGVEVQQLAPDIDGTSDSRYVRDAKLVLAAYRRWGPECVRRFEGDFAIVILDARENSAFAARDAVGIRPLYFGVTDGLFAASPTAAVFDLFPEIDTSVRWEWLADFIQGMSADWRETPFVGVRRLPPGHWLRVTQDDVTERRYHQFDADSPWEDTRDPRWLEAYRTELIRAVAVRTEPTGLIGVETSGGIDSSTILGVMAHAHPERIGDIHTFGFVQCQFEPEFMLETSIAHGVTHNHVLTGGVRIDRLGVWRAIGYPTEHPNAAGHMPFYDLAARLGIGTLHSGHGGDQGVTNTGGLALQEFLAHRQWRQALKDLPGSRLLRPARLARQIRKRTGESSHLTAPMLAKLAASPLRSDVLTERDLVSRTRIRSQYAAPFDRVNDFILGDRLSAKAAIRSADSSLVAASFGVDYRWALLDRRLVQQYLHTPAIWKFGDGYGRYLHRRALAGMVPDKVAWKPDKYMGPPVRPWLRQVSVDEQAHQRATQNYFVSSPEAFYESIDPRVRELLDLGRLRQFWTVQQDRSNGQTDALAARYLGSISALNRWLACRETAE